MTKKPHDNPQAHEPQDEEEELRVDVASLEEQVADLTEALQRERADAMNIRRRHDDQLANLKTTLKAGIIRELLPIVDNLERSLKHVPKELADSDYVKGVQGIIKQFAKTLADMGVRRIKTVGEPFDPYFHEAVSMEDGDGDHEEVIEELQAGYQLGEGKDAEILRHAMVRVAMR